MCAIGVVIYHLLYWSNTAKLYNLGLYGVYIFFVLSGASLYIQYSARFNEGLSIANFICVRYFRLAPLYILAVIAVPLVEKVSIDARFTIYSILNITLLFGFLNPGESAVVTGGWSLGIEVVFYFIFPVLIAFISKRWMTVLLAVLIAFVAQIIALNRTLANGVLVKNWVTYIQPLSFCFYFVAGCLMGRLLKEYPTIRAPKWLVWILFVGGVVFIATTSAETAEKSLLGINGIKMMILCVAVVNLSGYLSFGKMSAVAKAFGKMSYGIYLLHTFVAVSISRLRNYYHIFSSENIYFHIALVLFITATISLLLEKYYERPIRCSAKKRLLKTTK